MWTISLAIAGLWLSADPNDIPKKDARVTSATSRSIASFWTKNDSQLEPSERKSLERVARSADLSLESLQELLDPLCLVEVSINPESRVKAKRGPARARIRSGDPTFFLVKVVNDAGITQRVRVHGEGIATPDGKSKGWLEVVVLDIGHEKGGLNGTGLDYVLIRCRSRATGKREATLRFDAGQGTQDLGFRAEVPILFTIDKAE